MFTFATVDNVGRVERVRGSVIDVAFDDSLPPIFNLLEIQCEDRTVRAETLLHLDERTVRAVTFSDRSGSPGTTRWWIQVRSASARHSGVAWPHAESLR